MMEIVQSHEEAKYRQSGFVSILNNFLCAAAEDPYLGPNHISLFTAILGFAVNHNFTKPMYLFSRDLKKSAKIMSEATYHKCLHVLVNQGYIYYRASHSRFEGSEFGIVTFSGPM